MRPAPGLPAYCSTVPAFLDHSPPIAFAHRGGALERVENTLSAFSHAAELGYRFIETDVRATADGVGLLLHDPAPPELEGLDGQGEGLPWSRVQHARVGDEPVPRLEDVLTTFADVRFNLDLKTDEAVGPLIDALRRTGAAGRVCVGSFSDRRLAQVRAVFGPALATSMGPRDVRKLRAAASRLLPRRAVASRAVAAQVPETYGRVRIVDAAFVNTAHALGLQVHVWTVNDAAAMTRLLDLGVDGLMTDRPSVLRDTLRDRQQWAAA